MLKFIQFHSHNAAQQTNKINNLRSKFCTGKKKTTNLISFCVVTSKLNINVSYLVKELIKSKLILFNYEVMLGLFLTNYCYYITNPLPNVWPLQSRKNIYRYTDWWGRNWEVGHHTCLYRQLLSIHQHRTYLMTWLNNVKRMCILPKQLCNIRKYSF